MIEKTVWIIQHPCRNQIWITDKEDEAKKYEKNGYSVEEKTHLEGY